MQDKTVVDLTELGEPVLRTSLGFLDAVFASKSGAETFDKQKGQEEIGVMLRRVNGDSDVVELDLACSKPKPLPWSGLGKRQTSPQQPLVISPAPLSEPITEKLRSVPKPVPSKTNVIKNRSYLKSNVELHHKGKSYYEKYVLPEKIGLNQLMKLNSKMSKGGDPEPELPKKRERTEVSSDAKTMMAFLKNKQQEQLIEAKRKRKKPTGVYSQAEIEQKISISRAQLSDDHNQSALADIRRQNRQDLSHLYDFLLELTARQLEESLDQLKEVPNTFRDGSEFIDVMERNFLEEVRADISDALSSVSYSNASLVRLRHQERKDDWMILSVVEDTDKTRPMFQSNFRSDDFALVIPKTALPVADWRGTKNYFFAVCEHGSAVDRSSFTLFLKASVEKSASVNTKDEYYIVWVESLITILREFKMIRLAEWTDMSPFVFNPSCRRIPHKLSIPQRYFQFLNSKFNDSQVKAIEEACNIHSGVVLIQGPPGTGKTHTILGIISAFLLSTGYACNKPKVLVCAPSNAAIDELARRVVLQGVYNEYGDKRNDIVCIRIGSWTKEQLNNKSRTSANKQDPPEEVQRIALTTLVAERLGKLNIVDSSVEIQKIRKELNTLDQMIERSKQAGKTAQLESFIDQRRVLHNRLVREKDVKCSHEESRKAMSQELLSSADIVFTTLSGAFHKDMELTGAGWSFVIVDEACQAMELATLIPMQYGAKITVLIGDPMQLPGTTHSSQSKRTGFDRSLFERMMKAGCPVTMLEVQYRMAAAIRFFPSNQFYNGRLRDALETLNRTPPHWFPDLPLVFIDLLNSKESREGSDISTLNYPEAHYISNLYGRYKPYHGTGLDIGVITPYKSQAAAIRRILETNFGSAYKRDVEVNTVDSFQGREKTVIVFSCVRSGPSIGFLNDMRRLNVAITRAKFGLWVVGCAEALSKHAVWSDFIAYALEDNMLIKAQSQTDVSSLFEVKEKPKLQRIPVTIAREPTKREPLPLKNRSPDAKPPKRPLEAPKPNDFLGNLIYRMKRDRSDT